MKMLEINKLKDAIDSKVVGRKLWLIDIENMCGAGKITEEMANQVRNCLMNAYRLNQGDLHVVGTTHTKNCAAAGFAWPEARHVFMKGPDGGELSLIKALSDYDLSTFEKVVIASGDGMFFDTVKHLIGQGVDVSIVARYGSIHHRLLELTKKYTPFYLGTPHCIDVHIAMPLPIVA